MKNLKDMEKNENYFVREDIVSEQHVHHKDEYREKKRDKVILRVRFWKKLHHSLKEKRIMKNLNTFLGSLI